MEENIDDIKNEKSALVLIVDDIPKNLQLLSNALNKEGYEIAFASSGIQALEAAQNLIPDLILLDIMMPEMDGFEVCQKLKSDELLKEIPVIFITGKAETSDIVKGLQLGAVDYITKPFNYAELLSRVKTHIDLKTSKDKIVKYVKELEDTKAELQRINKGKDKFFSIIAHDLRSPFAGFMGLSQLIAEEVGNIPEDELRNMAASMNKAAKKLFDFLENLLEWSKSQLGKMEPNPSMIDIKESVERVCSLFKATANEKQINIINNIKESFWASADNNMLNTVLRNFISNAIKFTHTGGNVNISIKTKNDDSYIISVKDDGVGISSENIGKLFKIDVKFTTVGTANEHGSGLGLLVCKEFVEKNGGEVFVTSQEGQGTEFAFTLLKYKN